MHKGWDVAYSSGIAGECDGIFTSNNIGLAYAGDSRYHQYTVVRPRKQYQLSQMLHWPTVGASTGSAWSLLLVVPCRVVENAARYMRPLHEAAFAQHER